MATDDGEEPKPRLMIQRMELTNFKSYAGTVTIGPFEKSMTSVVGPNGSGKSNVIDAMLFVFGFRAKQMRQNKVSDLIHASEEHKDLEYARVSVFFQDIVDLPGADYRVVDKSQFVVTREARRDNSSKYWLDGKVMPFADVATRIRARGIDLDHNRFLILQGEVEQIAMMKPKAPTPHEDGLLEYLEDIIGSNKLKEPIEEAQKQVESLNEARGAQLHALKASEQQLKSLEERKAEAEAFIRAEAQLRQKRSALYQKNTARCSALISEAEARRSELDGRLADERSKRKENTDKLSALEKAYKKGKKEYEAVAALVEQSREEFQVFEREDIKNREQVKHLKKRLKMAQAGVAKEGKKTGEHEHELASRRQDVERLEGEEGALRSQAEGASAELEAIYDGLKGQTEPLRKKIEKAQKERAPEAEVLATLQSERQVVASEAALLQGKVADGRAALDAVEREIEELDAATAESKEEGAASAAEHKQMQATLAELGERHAALQRDGAAAAEEAAAARAKHGEAAASRGSAASANKQLTALMAAKRSGALKGMVGRLGSLGGITPEYDVAISTACGPLDYIVVADTDAAQQAVSLLRRQELGVASFIALDKQARARAPAPFGSRLFPRHRTWRPPPAAHGTDPPTSRGRRTSRSAWRRSRRRRARSASST